MSTASYRYRTSDAIWARMQLLIPKPTDHHPLGCHRPRVDDRRAMDSILFVLRTGCQWNALNATGLCCSSTAHRRFQEWEQAGVFWQMWCAGLMEYDELKRIDWRWLSADGALTKAPLAGEKNRPQSHGSGQVRYQTQPVDRRPRDADRTGRGGRQRERLQAVA